MPENVQLPCSMSARSLAWAVFTLLNPPSAFRNWPRYCPTDKFSATCCKSACSLGLHSMALSESCHITFRCSMGPFLCPSASPGKGKSHRFLTHNFSRRRVNAFLSRCYGLPYNFSWHHKKNSLRSLDREKTMPLAARKRYASERAGFLPLTTPTDIEQVALPPFWNRYCRGHF